MRTLRSLAVLLSLALVGAAVPALSAQAATNQKGTYTPLTSARLLDTRSGVGAPKAQLGAGKTLQLVVAGRGGVPTSGVSAVVLNLTVTGATASSYLSAYPRGQARPTVSSINFLKGTTRANTITVPLGSGQVSIYNNAGAVSVIADVVGFYAANDTPSQTLGAGNEFSPVEPDRLIDTRQTAEGALDAKTILTLNVDFGQDGEMSSSVRALALNVTAVNATGPGYLTTYDGGDTIPATSTLNFADKSATPNTTVVKTSLCTDCGSPEPVQFAVYNGSSSSVDVLVDFVGVYYNDGSVGDRFTPLTPVRISDSRQGLNAKPLTAKQTQTLTAPSSVVSAETEALVTNVTAIAPTAATYLTLWQAGDAKPAASNLNANAKATVANGAVVGISTTNKFNIYNNAGTTNFVIDVTGRFDVGSDAAAQRLQSKSSGSHDFTTATATSSRRLATAQR